MEVCTDNMEEGNDLVDESDQEGMETVNGGSRKVYLPGQSVGEDEELVHDRSAYYMYHAAQTGAPCLSFDIVHDSLGESRTEYPMTAYTVAGTQAGQGKQNFIILMKMSELHSTYEENEENSDSEDELDDDEPQLETVMVQHPAAINRIRVAPFDKSTIAATWSEMGSVHIWDLTKHTLLLDTPTAASAATMLKGHKENPLFTFSGHQSEGYALDWSRTRKGRLATGDCKHHIHVWEPRDDGSWVVDQRSYSAHSQSVEDIQWSPNEEQVFASCSVDHTIRVWDCRVGPTRACITATAHETDVNVIHWNSNMPFIVSGGDDGILKVWDLRKMQTSRGTAPAVAVFKHHSAPITSVEWYQSGSSGAVDSTVFASAGADNQIVQWDVSVERDDEGQGKNGDELQDVPPQLLFIHQGQEDIKELHWHSQLPGVLLSTAQSGFNIFKTISV